MAEIRDLIDDPQTRALRDMIGSPASRAAREMLDSPSMRAMREAIDSPLARAAREMFDTSQARAMRDLIDSPLARAARELVDSPSMRAMREAIDSPLARAAREMFDTSQVRAMRDIIDSPLARAARELVDSPSTRAMREAIVSPLARAARKFDSNSVFTAERLGLGGILSGASAQAVVGTLIASQVAAAARSTEDIKQLVGESFALDTLAATDENARQSTDAITYVLNTITTNIRKYLSAVQSLPELAGLVQLMMLLVTAAALYYAHQAPTAGDIEKLGERLESSNKANEKTIGTLEQKFGELIETIQQMTESKRQELVPRRLYVARRATPVKAEKSMRSKTVGQVEVGDKVSIIQIDRKWIEFDYFDYALGRASRGWAVKKYFSRLD